MEQRTTGGLPVELDIGDLALLVDQGVGVHAKALHVAVIGRDAHVILQESELHNRKKSLLLDSENGATKVSPNAFLTQRDEDCPNASIRSVGLATTLPRATTITATM